MMLTKRNLKYENELLTKDDHFITMLAKTNGRSANCLKIKMIIIIDIGKDHPEI